MRVLLVEDDVDLSRQLKTALSDAGYAVDHAPDGEEAWFLGDTEPYDVVVLDLGLPKIDGVSVLERWRREGKTTPVLILTARAAWSDKVAGFDAGADDYLTKPFHTEELLARLRALLRRSQAANSAVLSFGPLALDTAARSAGVWSGGQEGVGEMHTIDLGPREWTVLEYLLIHAPKPASKDKLLQALTGWDKEITPNAVEVYVSRLRAKLEPHGVALRSIRGFGYRLDLVQAETLVA